MSSKERLCLVCGSFVGHKYDQVLAGTETETGGIGMMHLECAWNTRSEVYECDHKSDAFGELLIGYERWGYKYCPKCGVKL